MERIPPSHYGESGTINPAGFAETITPANADLAYLTRSIYVGTEGNLTVKMAGGQNIVTFFNVPAGQVLPIRVSQIRLTGTTADNIVAIY